MTFHPALADAVLLYQQQRFDDAYAALRAVLDSAEASASAWSLMGYLQRDIGNAAAAAAAFDRALAQIRLR